MYFCSCFDLIDFLDSIKFSVDGSEVGNVEPPPGGFKSTSPFTHLSNIPWAAGSKMAPFDQEVYILH